MSYSKLATLAEKIHEKTISGKLAWEETAKRDVYQAEIGDASIQISQEAGDEVSDDILIRVFNREGNIVESFSDVDIKHFFESDPFEPQTPSAYKLMLETYETARRRALGTEQVLDNILGALETNS